MSGQTIELELVCDAKAELGEGPVWDANSERLYWVDILSHQLHIHDPQQPHSDDTLTFSPYISSVIPRASGGLVLTLQDGYYAYTLETRELTRLAEIEADLPHNRFNDGKCDPAGRYLAGTMSMTGEPFKGALYTLDFDHSVRQLASEVSISNGLAWSDDGGTLYYIDTPTQQVFAFDYDVKTGTLDNRRTVIEIPADQGSPDGMTIDSEGMLWIAHWGGWRVSRWNPVNGEMLTFIPIPAAQVTSCTFGGTELKELYITTAREGLSEDELSKQPLAGGLFRIDLGIRGVPASPYRG